MMAPLPDVSQSETRRSRQEDENDNDRGGADNTAVFAETAMRHLPEAASRAAYEVLENILLLQCLVFCIPWKVRL